MARSLAARSQNEHMNPRRNVRVVEALPPLLASFRRSLAASRLAESTIDHYLRSSRRFLTWAEPRGLVDVRRVTRAHVEEWVEAMHADGYAPHTVKHHYVGAKMWLKWLAAEGEIRADPTARIPMPKTPETEKDVVSREDVARVLDTLERAKRWRDASIIALFYDAGARVGEISAVSLADVDLDARILTLHAETTKGRRNRALRLSPGVVRLLDKYLRSRRDGADPHAPLFSGHMGRLTRSGLYTIVRHAFEEIGLTAKISPHDLRHTSATHVAGDLSDSEMMDLYGWKDLEMARHYSRKARERLALEAHDRASPLEALASLRKRRR